MTFKSFGIISLICIYLLILAGGIVRSTGSGMGCPDWPKCFGRYIPPTHASELPFNYAEIYKEKLHGEVQFNPTKTWIEYLNRLLGALTGLFVLIATVLGFTENRRIFWNMLAALLLVLANAVLGKYVVDSFLLPGVVTIHMLLSIGVLYFLIKALHLQENSIIIKSPAKKWIMINLVIVIIQITLGTQVRENMDHVIANVGENARGLWIENLGNIYIVHRTFSWVILISHVYLAFLLKKSPLWLLIYRRNTLIFISISFITGILMAYASLPLGSQAIHLVISLLLIGLHMKAYLKTEHV